MARRQSHGRFVAVQLFDIARSTMAGTEDTYYFHLYNGEMAATRGSSFRRLIENGRVFFTNDLAGILKEQNNSPLHASNRELTAMAQRELTAKAQAAAAQAPVPHFINRDDPRRTELSRVPPPPHMVSKAQLEQHGIRWGGRSTRTNRRKKRSMRRNNKRRHSRRK